MTQSVSITAPSDLAEMLDRLDRPDWVKCVELDEALDSDGESALWIWIVVSPTMPDQDTAQPVLSALRQRIRRLLSQQAPGLWAYIRIREDDNAE